MVPARLPRLAPVGAAGAALGAAALTLAAVACGGDDARPEAADPATRAALQVRQRYSEPDLAATGAWTWVAPDGATFVLVELQSTIAGLVQARADLWVTTDTGPVPIGRSEVLPAAAEIAAYRFEDLTGDGLPDLLGHVADSAGVAYPVFIPGAHGAMAELLEVAAPGWRFAAEPDSVPRVVAGTAGPCAVQLWVVEPAPDGAGTGWRYLALLRGQELGPPRRAPPACP